LRDVMKEIISSKAKYPLIMAKTNVALIRANLRS